MRCAWFHPDSRGFCVVCGHSFAMLQRGRIGHEAKCLDLPPCLFAGLTHDFQKPFPVLIIFMDSLAGITTASSEFFTV